MADGWTCDGAVQDRIDDTAAAAVKRARASLSAMCNSYMKASTSVGTKVANCASRRGSIQLILGRLWRCGHSASRVLTAWLFVLASSVLSHAQGSEVFDYGPGVKELTVSDNRTDRPLAGNVWYPTTTPEKMQRAGKSKVWKMALADLDGEAAEGRFPLLVVSHGMYGNMFNQAWLGSELSRRGYIVAMVNHPGTSTFLRDADQARQLWDRPVDLSRLITYLVEESDFRERIDADRVYAAGHSLGGYTVMLAAGAVFDPDLYQSGCKGDAEIPVVCGVLNGWSVAETPADKVEMARSRKDAWIKKVVSLDLGLTPVLSRDSLAAIDVPVLVLGSGRADMLDQSLESRALAAALPDDKVRHVELDDAGHFDFMGVCKPDGFSFLEKHEPGDEIVCIKGGAEREKQHERIVAEIVRFLEE